MAETLKEQQNAKPVDAVKAFERRALAVAVAAVVLIGGTIAGLAYVAVSQKVVSIDQSMIQAPEVDLAPSVSGVLRNMYVTEGQVIPPNTVVAQVGDELLKSTSGGLVISAEQNIGENVAAGTPIVKTIDPSQLRVVGQIDENKGLASIKVGDPVTFTVDAFGSQTFTGVVDEISPTSHASGVVFNISDQRQTQTFDVKARYDVTKYPQFKNGMSARMWVYTK